MDDRLKRTIALLLVGGGLLVVVGLVLVLQSWPTSVSYQVDGLTNGMPLTELEDTTADVNLRLSPGLSWRWAVW